MSKAQELANFDAKQKANPPGTPALVQLAAAQRAQLAYEAKIEKSQATQNFVSLQNTILRKINDPHLIDLKTTVRRSEMQVAAEQAIAVPKWDQLLAQAQGELDKQQTSTALLAAKAQAQQTVHVAAIAAAALGLIVAMEIL